MSASLLVSGQYWRLSLSKNAAMMRIPGGIFTTIACDVITFSTCSTAAVSSSRLCTRSSSLSTRSGSISYELRWSRTQICTTIGRSSSCRKLWPTFCR